MTHSCDGTDPVYIYRCYDDADTLLYVGMSRNVGRRMAEHERLAEWHRWCVRVVTAGPMSRSAGRELEARLIRRMSPLFNDGGGAGYVARRDPDGARALAEAARCAINRLTLPTPA